MKFSEALKLLADGRKIRIVQWLKGSYVSLEKTNKGCEIIHTEAGGKRELFQWVGLNTLMNNDWEEYNDGPTFKELKVGQEFRWNAHHLWCMKIDTPNSCIVIDSSYNKGRVVTYVGNKLEERVEIR